MQASQTDLAARTDGSRLEMSFTQQNFAFWIVLDDLADTKAPGSGGRGGTLLSSCQDVVKSSSKVRQRKDRPITIKLLLLSSSLRDDWMNLFQTGAYQRHKTEQKEKFQYVVLYRTSYK